MFDKLEVGSIAVNSVIAGVIKLNGHLNWHRGDAIYGNGFAGDVTLGFSFNRKIDKNTEEKIKYDVSIMARAAFGRKKMISAIGMQMVWQLSIRAYQLSEL